MYAPVPALVESIATRTIGAAIQVHRVLGPGFRERIYHAALCIELQARGLQFERELPVAVHYRGIAIPGQRIDLVVESCLVVELKASSRLDIAYDAQLISYLRTTGLRLGLLFNFNAPTLKDGIRRIVAPLCPLCGSAFVTFVATSSWCPS